MTIAEGLGLAGLVTKINLLRDLGSGEVTDVAGPMSRWNFVKQPVFGSKGKQLPWATGATRTAHGAP